MKRIYLATPVNARKEKTMRHKMKAAHQRKIEMENYLRKVFPDALFYSSFDIPEVFNFIINEYDKLLICEPEIMGKCIEMVMLCDMIILDDGWENSKGCTVERFVAMQYGKHVRTFNSFVLKEKLNK